MFRLNPPCKGWVFIDQQFAKIFPFCTEFRLRCRTACGPRNVRHAQLAAQTGLILTNQGTDYFTRCLGKCGVSSTGCTKARQINQLNIVPGDVTNDKIFTFQITYMYSSCNIESCLAKNTKRPWKCLLILCKYYVNNLCSSSLDNGEFLLQNHHDG